MNEKETEILEKTGQEEVYGWKMKNDKHTKTDFFRNTCNNTMGIINYTIASSYRT